MLLEAAIELAELLCDMIPHGYTGIPDASQVLSVLRGQPRARINSPVASLLLDALAVQHFKHIEPLVCMSDLE